MLQKLFQRVAQPQIVNIMNSDVVLSRSLLEQLVIVDDSDTTYNAYKNNTIRIASWQKSVRGDRELRDCLEVIE